MGEKAPISAKVLRLHLSVNLPSIERERSLIGFSGFGPAYISLPVL